MAEDGGFKHLRFNDTHNAWFPQETALSAELWSEYLSVFWLHRANGHYYLNHGTLIKPGDICLDCGACEGFFGLQALAAGAAKVICIEPSETMAACLKKTFAAEIKTGRVLVENVAAGVMEGTVRFSFDGLDPFSGRIGAATTAINIPMTTITKICADLRLSRVDFIKMDIEGAEIQALEGALPLLEKFHPKLAITTYHRPFDYAALRALAIAAGYQQIRSAGLTQRDDGIYRPMMLHAWK
jgi:FkbM family methyltransferase